MNIIKKLQQIKTSARDLSCSSLYTRNSFMKKLLMELKNREKEILLANKRDIKRARDSFLSANFIKRLAVTEESLKSLYSNLETLLHFSDPINKVIEKRKIQNNLVLRRVSVPLGVIFMIYEARPEVTLAAAALCIKSGNCVILKGGKEAFSTNQIFFELIQKSLPASLKNCVWWIGVDDRKTIKILLKQDKYIDLVIPRGGAGMTAAVSRQTSIPVLFHSAGGARIYVDKSADLEMAVKIIINSKISNPSACNSLDTILIHKKAAKNLLDKLLPLISKNQITISDKNFADETLGLRLNIKTVNSIDDALVHIQQFGKGHTEGIIAQDKKVVDMFVRRVDAASIMINCSTRLHDGGVYGLGGEMGIATGKLHARGPVGLNELTTYKWIVLGEGQIRK